MSICKNFLALMKWNTLVVVDIVERLEDYEILPDGMIRKLVTAIFFLGVYVGAMHGDEVMISEKDEKGNYIIVFGGKKDE